MYSIKWATSSLPVTSETSLKRWELVEVLNLHITRGPTGATVTMPQGTGVFYIIYRETLDPLDLEPEKTMLRDSVAEHGEY